MKDKETISIDVLKHLEDLSNQINKMMASHAKTGFQRYPVTFGLLILLGVIALHEGLKGVLEELGLFTLNPWALIAIGLLVLTVTGILYSKLED